MYTTPDPKRRLSIFTDASEAQWSGELIQASINGFKSETPLQDWNHHPVAFVSGYFKGCSVRWTIPEKEFYAIISSVTRLAHFIVAFVEFSILNDQKHPIILLSPAKFVSNVACHVVHKVQRWSMRLSEFNQTIEHIPGENNTWADNIPDHFPMNLSIQGQRKT